jgi:hypothetical protein
LEGTDQRVQLVVLDVNTRPEWALQTTSIASLGIEIELADRPPLDCMQVGTEGASVVETVVRIGQRGRRLFDPGTRLDFPNDLEFLAVCVIVDGRQSDYVLGQPIGRSVNRGRQHRRS